MRRIYHTAIRTRLRAAPIAGRGEREAIGSLDDALGHGVVRAAAIACTGTQRVELCEIVVRHRQLATTILVQCVVAFVGCGQPERCLARQTAAMTRAWLFACLVACGSTQAATTIRTPQDYEHVVGDVVERVIEIFRDGGINCNMISGELRALNGSQKVDAARRWRKDHPESNQTMRAAIFARKGELEKVMGPAARQCEGPIQGLVAELTE